MFNHTHLIRRVVAGVAIGVAAAPGVAHADMLAFAGPGALPAVRGPVSPARSDSSTQPGFVWGDAGIGAGGAVLLIGGGVAVSAAATRRRRVVRAA